MKLHGHPVKTGQARRGLSGNVISFYPAQGGMSLDPHLSRCGGTGHVAGQYSQPATNSLAI
jgi:hypothetical protein